MGVAAALCALIGARYAANPVPDYGQSGAPYIEHQYRLQVVELWQAPDGPGLLRFLAEADRIGQSYPPLMHVIYLPVGGLFGHGAPHVSWFGVVWFLGLAVLVGCVAWSLTRSSPAAMAAIAATLLVPSLHATATRYYYDLPMTALLWLCVALLLVTRRGRPRLGGVLVGIAWFTACLVKWTAIPFGLFMVGGAALCPLPRDEDDLPGSWRPRAQQLGIAAAVLAVLVALFLAGSTASVGEMSRTFVVDDAAAARVADSRAGVVAGVGATAWVWLDKLTGLVADPPLDEAWFFLSRLVLAVLSPALTVLVVALALRGRRHLRGLPLVGVALVGQLLFLSVSIQYPDERFLLTLAPVFPLAAAVAWSGLGLRERWIWAAFALVFGAGVALDLHLRRPGAGRGLGEYVGLQSSFEQRGWGRSDEERPYFTASRAAVEDLTEVCGPAIAAAPLDRGEPPDCLADRLRVLDPDLLRGLVALCQEDHWWEYRSELASVEPAVHGGVAGIWEYVPVGDGRAAIRTRRVVCGCVDLAAGRLQR